MANLDSFVEDQKNPLVTVCWISADTDWCSSHTTDGLYVEWGYNAAGEAIMLGAGGRFWRHSRLFAI